MALIVANWKMNLDVAASTLLFERYSRELINTRDDIVVCPSLLALYPVYQAMQKSKSISSISLGAQNFYSEDEGAFTGEVSAYQLRDLISYAIIGHSERRIHFHESDQEIAAKVAAAVRHGITPIVCVGESLTEHQAGQTNQVVLDQLAEDLADIANEDAYELVIAYEPVWAIGTGHEDSPSEVAPVFAKIRAQLASNFSSTVAKKARLLYGGSVNGHDAHSYLALSDCNGLLVGHASLNDKEFGLIAEA